MHSTKGDEKIARFNIPPEFCCDHVNSTTFWYDSTETVTLGHQKKEK